MALFRMAFFRLFALVFRHFAWRISFFRLFAWRYFVFSLFRLAFFRYFVFSLGVISSWRRAITPGEKTKERNNEMAQTSHHIAPPRFNKKGDGWLVQIYWKSRLVRPCVKLFGSSRNCPFSSTCMRDKWRVMRYHSFCTYK